MDIFSNIIFDEFTLLEGEQAENYKKRKAEEKLAKDKADQERRDRRYPRKGAMYNAPGSKQSYSKSGERYKGQGDRVDYHMTTRDNFDRGYKATKLVSKDVDRRYEENDKARTAMQDYDAYHDIGDRPKGIFKGKEKKKWDEENEKNKSNKKALETEYKKANKNLHNTDSKVAIDAANRHIRRHPKRYKESTFENIEMI